MGMSVRIPLSRRISPTPRPTDNRVLEGKGVRLLYFGFLLLTLLRPYTLRPLRLALGGGCYHVINRGNGRAFVFRIEADFLAFERVFFLACERNLVRAGLVKRP